MHVVWLKSDYIDPPDTGGKLRTYNLLRELKRLCGISYVCLANEKCPDRTANARSWASSVATFARPEEAKEGWGFYGRLAWRMFSSRPYIVQKYSWTEIRKCQQALFAKNNGPARWDQDIVLVCDFLEMTGNVVWSLPCPKILFQHNVESVIWQRYHANEANRLRKAYCWFEAQRLRRYESDVCNRFDLVLAVSPTDKDVLQHKLGVTVPIEIIETGVDTEYFAPRPGVATVPGRLVFVGSLDWMPNIDGILWFTREVYPRIRATCPEVTLDIVGRRPISAIQTLATADPSIRVCGSVPDVRPYVAAADLFIVPLRIGSGTRLKIFEAMAMQRPVVSTTVGAEGLPMQEGRHLWLADSADQFADVVISVLADPGKKRSVAADGYKFVTHNYSWRQVSTKLYEACVSVCRSERTGSRGT